MLHRFSVAVTFLAATFVASAANAGDAGPSAAGPGDASATDLPPADSETETAAVPEATEPVGDAAVHLPESTQQPRSPTPHADPLDDEPRDTTTVASDGPEASAASQSQGYRMTDDGSPRQRDVPRTLLDSPNDRVVGGFGGVGVMYTRVAGRDVPAVCAEGALIVAHKLTIGGGGCGIAAEIDAQDYGPGPHDPDDRLAFGYGGVIVRYHFFSEELTNLAVGVLVGGGGLAISPWYHDEDEEPDHAYAEGVFVVEPQVAGYLNVARWMRVGVNVGYRLTSRVQTEGLDTSDVSGLIAGAQAQFGWF